MCGIVGLFLKSPALAPELGNMMQAMLAEMCDRGPDSAGFALYTPPEGRAKLICQSKDDQDWDAILREVGAHFAADVTWDVIADHARLHIAADPAAVRAHLLATHPHLNVFSSGHSIEIYKGVGDPMAVAERYRLSKSSGSHGIAHTRMATESAVTIAGSHPFSTGLDTCLVHNGSLSNHNRLRERLERAGETLQTLNDSEVAAAYLAWRMRLGDSLDGALTRALTDLDGFYTFTIGTAEGFAVLRDPIACKPAVVAETGDWVAVASEYRAIAPLPGADTARIWEPEPGRIYSWSHAALMEAA